MLSGRFEPTLESFRTQITFGFLPKPLIDSYLILTPPNKHLFEIPRVHYTGCMIWFYRLVDDVNWTHKVVALQK